MKLAKIRAPISRYHHQLFSHHASNFIEQISNIFYQWNMLYYIKCQWKTFMNIFILGSKKFSEFNNQIWSIRIENQKPLYLNLKNISYDSKTWNFRRLIFSQIEMKWNLHGIHMIFTNYTLLQTNLQDIHAKPQPDK